MSNHPGESSSPTDGLAFDERVLEVLELEMEQPVHPSRSGGGAQHGQDRPPSHAQTLKPRPFSTLSAKPTATAMGVASVLTGESGKARVPSHPFTRTSFPIRTCRPKSTPTAGPRTDMQNTGVEKCVEGRGERVAAVVHRPVVTTKAIRSKSCKGPMRCTENRSEAGSGSEVENMARSLIGSFGTSAMKNPTGPGNDHNVTDDPQAQKPVFPSHRPDNSGRDASQRAISPKKWWLYSDVVILQRHSTVLARGTEPAPLNGGQAVSPHEALRSRN
ncbi:hypothetical protein EDB85DRAFT_1888717 [Lactarius pseudohatsudake]|nr:hypothetical protein EDB85DRAFT_1888717 [Lactarius pseudohatsudake]